ncbi:MAG: S-adenosylmethionine:tRNA ribosyltransferase-isomerase [Candidatus Aminicenantes bacterium ADurb.Bin508]|nr:MAG: S-adenosylmethionine:tRNA ribosyltransferase-isomerase [Candidatus Aminicenantes bacterium ADurb.Bin508]
MERAEVTLNVGEATFQPLRVERVEDHKMKKEWAEVGEETAQRVEKALREGRRVLAVGTTSVRTLESFTGADGLLKRGKMATDLFIYPGYRFKAVSGMITNFHLPKSTLMMLISAMAGTEKVQKAYGYAIKEGYRFFSYGDAMLIL